MSMVTGARDERAVEERGVALPRYRIRTYRLPAKVFHWVTAALVLFMITSGVLMKQLGSGPVADLLFGLHKTTGIMTLSVVLLRVVYRLLLPDPGTGSEDYRRPTLHFMLYGISLPSIWPQGSPWADFLLETHAYLAFGMLALVALHIGIAMQDHMTRARDATDD
jgi:cytochrome b561